MWIEKLAYRSRLKKIPTAIKMATALFTLLLCIAAEGLLFHSIMIAAALLIVIIAGKTPARQVGRLFVIPAGFVVAGCIAIAFGKSDHTENMLFFVAFHNMFWGITKSGIILCIRLILKSMSALCCMYFISLTTPMTELFILLRRTRIPIFLIEIMELIYRFIFVLYDAKNKIHTAQRARMGDRNIKGRFYAAGILISKLFIRAMYQVEKTNQAMESRGYDGNDIQILTSNQKISVKQKLITAGALIIIFLCFLTDYFLVVLV